MLTCNTISFSQFDCGNETLSEKLGVDAEETKLLPDGSDCDVDLDGIPVKTIRVVYHVFQKSDGSENIPNTPAGRGFIAEMHNKANFGFANMDPVTHSTTSSYIPDSKIRLERMATHFWQNDTYWGYSSVSSSSTSLWQGNQLFNFIQNQPIANRNDAIHIFLTGTPNLNSPRLAGIACWFGCYDWSIVDDAYGHYLDGYPFYKLSPVVRHEIGHNLDLYHTHSLSGDRCDDTPPMANVFNANNNMMSYNAHQDALTEDQVSRVHKMLQFDNSIVSSGIVSEDMTALVTNSGNNGYVYQPYNIQSSTARIHFSSSSGNASNFSFVKTSGSGSFSEETSGIVDLSNLGSINLMVTWEENCLTFSKEYVFFNAPQYLIGPNPASDELFVSLEHEELTNDAYFKEKNNKNYENLYVNIFDARGRVLMKDIRISPTGGKINISNLKPDVLFVRVSNQARSFVKKIVKK